MNAAVVDASMWVAYLVPGDVFHARSRAWFSAARSQGVTFVAPALLLVEVAAALARRTGDGHLAHRAAKAVETLPDLRLVPLDAALTPIAVDAAAQLRVRGADAVYIAVAARLGIPLVTLDQEQARRAQAWVSVLVPS